MILFDAARPKDPAREVVELHFHSVRHDPTDEWVSLPVRSVAHIGYDPMVEMGPLSIRVDEARLLAASLTIMADLAEQTYRKNTAEPEI